MKTAKTESSSISWHSSVLRPHRRSRTSFLHIISFAISGIGDGLYLLGATIERRCKNFGRRFRKAFLRIARIVGSAIAAAYFKIVGQVRGVAQDLSAPFKKGSKSVGSLFRIIQESAPRGGKYTRERVRLFFQYGWRFNKGVVSRFFNYLAPAVALVLCAVVVINVFNLHFALEVNYNGMTVGYIEDEGVYDSARKIIQNRMISGDEQVIWNDETELRIAVVQPEQVLTQDVMADALLSASGSEIAQATGIYVGGVFYGATTATELLKDQLTGMIAASESMAAGLGENAVVRFARNVQFQDGVFPSNSIRPYEELVADLTTNHGTDLYYTAKMGESPLEIASNNGISVDRLQQLNPGVVLDFSETGATLVVAQNEPVLRVKTVVQVTEVTPVGFESETIRDNSREGFVLLQEGQPGERTTVRELEYDSTGNIVAEIVISDEITTPPINQQVIVGRTSGGGSSIGGGILSWPTGPFQMISRGWIPGLHYGIDIAGVYNTAIYAAESGQVIFTANTNVGYGNYINIRHAGGMDTLYAHLNTILVTDGEFVQRGQVIGLMGSTGNSTGSHLHFEVRIDGVRVPPEPWIY